MAEQGLKIKDIKQKLGANAVKKLGDLSLPVEVVAGDIEEDLSIKVEGATFALSGSAGIFAFNSVDDADPLGVIGAPGKDPKSELAPQIAYQPGSTWIKYQAMAGAKAAGGLEQSGFGFSLDAAGSVLVSAYRRHDPGEALGLAVAADLAEPRLIFSKQHVKQLEQGEAVALKARGKLAAGIELKWADIFAGSLTVLGSLLDAREVFAIKIDAGLSASFDVSLEDEFTLVFSRVAGGRIRVAVKKSDKRTLSAAIAATVGAQFAKPQAVQQVLGMVVAGLLGEPLGKVKAILAKGSFDKLSAKQKQDVDRLLDRLGIDSPQDKIAALKQKLADLEASLAGGQGKPGLIEKIARARVEAGFKYEYSRVTTDSVLLQAVLRDASLDAHHGELIRGRIRGLLDAAEQPGSGVTLERYLNEKTKKISRAWGLSLSAGKWFSISGRDVSALTEVVRTTADGRRQISFVGSRGYAGDSGGDRATWNVDFAASMPDFSASTSPLAGEFEYSLFLSMSQTEKKVKASEVARLLDQAIIWDAVTAGGAAAEAERLKGILAGRGARFSYQLKLDDTAFRGLLGRLAAMPTDGFARALGEAMPWYGRFGEARRLPAMRRTLYGGLWQRYFAESNMSPSALAALSQVKLRRDGFVALAAFEGQRWGTFRTLTAAGLATLNRRTRDNWHRFAAGMQILEGAIAEGRAYAKVQECYRKIRPLFAQSHHVKGLGVLLLDLLGSRPELYSHVERICTVEYSEGGRKMIESISTA